MRNEKYQLSKCYNCRFRGKELKKTHFEYRCDCPLYYYRDERLNPVITSTQTCNFTNLSY